MYFCTYKDASKLTYTYIHTYVNPHTHFLAINPALANFSSQLNQTIHGFTRTMYARAEKVNKRWNELFDAGEATSRSFMFPVELQYSSCGSCLFFLREQSKIY